MTGQSQLAIACSAELAGFHSLGYVLKSKQRPENDKINFVNEDNKKPFQILQDFTFCCFSNLKNDEK
jgi:hypothetical protein